MVAWSTPLRVFGGGFSACILWILHVFCGFSGLNRWPRFTLNKEQEVVDNDMKRAAFQIWKRILFSHAFWLKLLVVVFCWSSVLPMLSAVLGHPSCCKNLCHMHLFSISLCYTADAVSRFGSFKLNKTKFGICT